MLALNLTVIVACNNSRNISKALISNYNYLADNFINNHTVTLLVIQDAKEAQDEEQIVNFDALIVVPITITEDSR